MGKLLVFLGFGVVFGAKFLEITLLVGTKNFHTQ
jgi:hypothetical protein